MKLSVRTNLPRRNAWWLLVAGVLIFTGLELVESFYFLRDDNALYSLPAYVHDLRAVVADGELAHLNLFQYQGIPHLAAAQTGVLYPPVYAAVLLARAVGDVRWAIEILVVGHLLAAMLGMYFFLRRLGLRQGAVAGGLVFVTLPFVVISARSWISFVYAAAYLVWGLHLLLRWNERPTWARTVSLSAVKLLFFFAGYPQMVLYAVICEGLFLGFLWGHGLRVGRLLPAEVGQRAGRLAVAAFLTLAWASPLLLPLLEAKSLSAGRQGALPLEVFLQYPLDPAAFLRAQVFSFRAMEVHGASSALFHLGLPFLAGLLGGIYPWKRGEHASPYPIRVLAVLGLLALVASTKAWKLAYGLPLLSSFRWPFKNFLFFAILALPAAAWSFERLNRRWRIGAWLLLAATVVGHLSIAGGKESRASFGFLEVPRPVESYRKSALLEGIDPSSRIVTFRSTSHSLDGDLAAELRVQNFATLFGEEAHFSGYLDPLISDDAYRTALGSRWGSLPMDERHADPRVLAHLARWSVEGLLVPSARLMPQAVEFRRRLLATGLVEPVRVSPQGVELLRLRDARPMIENLADGSSVEHHRETNGFRFENEGGPRAIRIAVRAMEGWSWTLDGVAMDPPVPHPEGGLLLAVPAGRHAVRLHYETPRFDLGLVLASLTSLLVVVAFVSGRVRQRS